MRYRHLTRTELSVSSVCLGCADFGGSIDAAGAFDLLDRYVAGGGNFLDTAHFYGRWLPGGESVSELLIGRWMAARGNRDAIVVGTKGGHPEFSPGFETRPLRHRLSAAEIGADLESSLTHFRTDYIDLYWLHYDDPSRPVGDMIDALDAQVRRGNIRWFGLCNWSAARLREANAYCAVHDIRGFVASQVLWNLASHNRAALWVDGLQSMSGDMRSFHREHDIAAVPYSAQAGGFFSKYARSDFAEDARFARLRAWYMNPESARRAARVARYAAESGHEPSQIALACLINQPFTTVPIVGPKNAEQLQSCVAAADIALDAADMAFLAGR